MGSGSTLGPQVDCYNMAPITLGRRSTVSQRAFLCAGSHDLSDPDFPLVARPIRIGDDVWIAAEAFIAPGLRIEDGAVLAARGAAFVDLQAWTVYRGNPAAVLRARRLRPRAPPVSARPSAQGAAEPGTQP
jgi:putative colanic acid biosynthesis acetyltransferase WcaF